MDRIAADNCELNQRTVKASSIYLGSKIKGTFAFGEGDFIKCQSGIRRDNSFGKVLAV